MAILVATNSLDIVEGSVENAVFMTFTDFCAAIYSDEGLDEYEAYFIDANNLDSEVYQDLSEVGGFDYFTLEDSVPEFISDEDFDKLHNWTHLNSQLQESTNESSSDDDFEIPMGNSKEKTQSVSQETGVIDTNQLVGGQVKTEIEGLLNGTSEAVDKETKGQGSYDNKNAKVYLFGSSKGGSGKTFTTIISARRYAMTHPNESVALLDFDIIDGQVGISIHSMTPTMFNYYKEYMKGYNDFRSMKENIVKGNEKMPDNLDFYLAPNNGRIIQNDGFWLNILSNLIHNYDVLFIDTGIDYLNVHPISYAYKIADKINITTTTSIKSVNSVTKMINKLTGAVENSVFGREDELESKINIIITQMDAGDEMNTTAYSTLSKLANIEATFGVITRSVSQAEYYGSWDVFDDNDLFCAALDGILEL